MTKEIYISSTPHETRLAVVEDDNLAEIYYERENEYTLAGSVYKGKVTRVLPGMQSAFVDIGLERDAFLYVTDFAEEQEDGEDYVALPQGTRNGRQAASSNGSGNHESSAHSHGPQKQATAGRGESAPESASHPDSNGQNGQGEQADQRQEAGSGGRRWRGRRGRRRGRGNAPQHHASASSAETSSEQDASTLEGFAPDSSSTDDFSGNDFAETHPREISDFLLEPVSSDREQESHQVATDENGASKVTQQEHPQDQPSEYPPGRHRATDHPPMVLPGESLSKYRQAGEVPEPIRSTPQDRAEAASAPQKNDIAPAPTFHPSTMVLTPLEWDGSGLLPGESISRYKNETASKAPATAAAPAREEAPIPHKHPIEKHPIVQHPLGSVDAHAEESTQTGEPSAPQAREESAPGQTPSAESDIEPLEMMEASASYRFDPSTSSAYRQSSVAEADEPLVETVQDKPSPAQDQPAESFSTEPAVSLTESIETAAVASSLAAEAALPAEEPAADIETSTSEVADSMADDEDLEDDALDQTGTHHFNPGLGNLEEETIDEEEPEVYAAQNLTEDETYDDLIEETLDLQMDSGLLSELVRDQHVDKRTGYAEDHGRGPEPEDGIFDEEHSEFEDEHADIELEEMPNSDEDSEDTGDTEASNADATRQRPGTSRGSRRGVRGQRPGHGGTRGRMRRSTAQTTNLPAITELLKPNQEILVQIAKEPIARKGARITSHIALPGRFLVFMPTVNHVGVSRKISSDEERQRLKQILLSEKGEASGGFIVRTAAASAARMTFAPISAFC